MKISDTNKKVLLEVGGFVLIATAFSLIRNLFIPIAPDWVWYMLEGYVLGCWVMYHIMKHKIDSIRKGITELKDLMSSLRSGKENHHE